jgi:hypothetical protein
VAASTRNTKSSAWNSLEVCKLAAAVATPILIVFLGALLWLTQRDIVQHWERDLQEQRRLADARIKESDNIRDFRLTLYREAAPLLNDIVSYHFYVGRWKERSPADIIDKKRRLDTLLYSHRPLFSAEFVSLYHDFMRQAFRGAREFHGESRIRTNYRCHLPEDTSGQWSAYFTDEDTRSELCTAYISLLGRVSAELLLQSLKLSSDAQTSPSPCPPLYDLARCRP